MIHIKTFVIFDLETTGLPFQEYNRTKITELCFLAVNRQDIRRTKPGEIPTLSKLTLLLNPDKVISEKTSEMTGLTNEKLKYAPKFKEKFKTIFNFLNDLEKPVCLVAHNGNIFDYKILLAECYDARVCLPEDLLCLDSLVAFKKIEKEPVQKEVDIPDLAELLTDDEDDWPDLNLTNEDLHEIEELCSSFEKSTGKCKKKKNVNVRKSYKLIDIYKRFFTVYDDIVTHRAEDDCIMLLQCIVACQSNNNMCDFLKWADENCKLLTDIVPLKRK